MRTALLSVALFVAACSKQVAPVPPAPAPKGAAPTPHAATPVTPDAGSAPDAGHVAGADTVETEVSGSVDSGKVKAATVQVYMSVEPCAPLPMEVNVLIKEGVHGGKYGFEFFPKIGSSAHLCAAAVDDQGHVVALGAYAKNPLKFEGNEEIILERAAIKLKPIKPKPVPTGL